MTPLPEPWPLVILLAGVASIYLFIGLGEGWLMRALQITIVMAVIGSNVQWHWTHSGFLAGLVGIGAAFVLTVAPLLLWDRLRRQRRSGVSGDIVEREELSEPDP